MLPGIKGYVNNSFSAAERRKSEHQSYKDNECHRKYWHIHQRAKKRNCWDEQDRKVRDEQNKIDNYKKSIHQANTLVARYRREVDSLNSSIRRNETALNNANSEKSKLLGQQQQLSADIRYKTPAT